MSLPASGIVQTPLINKPGIVKARPPATIAPADIPVEATLTSFKLLLLKSRIKVRDNTATNIVGQGRALMRKATYIDDAVMRIEPNMARSSALTVKLGNKDDELSFFIRTSFVFSSIRIDINTKKLIVLTHFDC